MAKKKRKPKLEPFDGLGPKELKDIRSQLRKAFSWSRAVRVCKARALGKDGFPRCEKCKKKVPKVFVDHVVPCGEVMDPGFLERMFVPSSKLQAWCNKCHREKTNEESRARREREKTERWKRALK